MLDELAQRNVYVSISLDGPPEVQDRQRPDADGAGISGRLPEIIGGLLSYNPCTDVVCVCTPASGHQLDTSVRWLFDQGFAYVSPTLDWTAAWSRKDLGKLRRSLERLADWYVERTLAGEKFYLSLFDERIRAWTRGPPQACERCSFGYAHFSIAPSGRLYPCVQFVGEDKDEGFAIGDVHRGFDEDNRSRLHALAVAEKAECIGCALQSRCSSWCACVNFQTSGRVDRVGPLVCEWERVLIPIADRATSRGSRTRWMNRASGQI